MIGREDLDQCPKCHNTGIHLQHEYGPEAVTSIAKLCDCSMAEWYVAQLLAQAQANFDPSDPRWQLQRQSEQPQ